MQAVTYSCKQCRAPLPDELINREALATCPSCAARFMFRVYPAATAETAPAAVESDACGDAAAGCFYHAGRPAGAVCETCGRFICALCRIEYRQGYCCPACIRRDIDRAGAPDVIRRHVRYDKIALTLALAPLLFWPLTAISGPAAMIAGIRYWNRPVSLVTRGRGRLVLAIVLGFMQTAAWVSLLVVVLNQFLG